MAPRPSITRVFFLNPPHPIGQSGYKPQKTCHTVFLVRLLKMGPEKLVKEFFGGVPYQLGLLICPPRLKTEKISVEIIFDQGGMGPNPRFSVSGPEKYVGQGRRRGRRRGHGDG